MQYSVLIILLFSCVNLYSKNFFDKVISDSHYSEVVYSNNDHPFSDTTICEEESVFLEFLIEDYDQNCTNFEWSGSNGFYSNDIITEFSLPGLYYLEVDGCSFLNDTFELYVISDSIFSFPDSLICEGDTLSVDFPSDDISNFSDFIWYNNDAVFEMEDDLGILITEPGVYSLDINGCNNLSDNFVVNFYEYSLSFTDGDIYVDSVMSICIEENPVLTTFEDFPHVWYLDGITIDTLVEPTLVLDDILDQINLNQIYTYDVEIDFGCGIVAANNSIEVSVVECECGLDMPNIFTPDGNEKNDYFKPFNNYEGEFVDPEILCKSTDFQMEIFNQWGKHVVSINSYDEFPYWDGLNAKGKKMNSGIYFYRITYQVNIYSLPEMKEITGYFHLF